VRTENTSKMVFPRDDSLPYLPRCKHLGEYLRLLGRYAVLRFDPLHEVSMPINYFQFLHMWR
jgi:hypothetical protein